MSGGSRGTSRGSLALDGRYWLLTCAVALAPVLAGPGTAAAQDESCQELQAKKQTLSFPELLKALEAGPEWAQANLKPEDIEKLREWLSVEERLLFQCRGEARRRPATAAAGPQDTPLPVRKPMLPGMTPPSPPPLPEPGPRTVREAPPPPIPAEPAPPPAAVAAPPTPAVEPPAPSEPPPAAEPPAAPESPPVAEPAEPPPAPATAASETEPATRSPEPGSPATERRPAEAPEASGQPAAARVKPGDRPPFRPRVEP